MQVYAYWETVGTRWGDNDIYGHVNNTVYYSLMDTVINNWLIRHAGLEIHTGDPIGLCVESHCVFKTPAAFPEPIRVGLRVGHLGRSSVRYEVGLFSDDTATDDGSATDDDSATEDDSATDDDSATVLAEGHFVHVFVDRRTRRPVPIEGPMRQAMLGISTVSGTAPGTSPG